jgi:hypothetical protein
VLKCSGFFNNLLTFSTKFLGNEIIKLCIGVDNWTKKQWESMKGALEYSIECEFEKPVTASKLDVLQYLLICFEHGSTSSYVELFEEEDVEVMHKRKLGLLKSESNEESALD